MASAAHDGLVWHGLVVVLAAVPCPAMVDCDGELPRRLTAVQGDLDLLLYTRCPQQPVLVTSMHRPVVKFHSLVSRALKRSDSRLNDDKDVELHTLP